jgi:hypothetical protein
MELKLNGPHRLLTYVDVNLLGDNIDAINKNSETSIDACKEVGLEVLIEKTAKIRKHNTIVLHVVPYGFQTWTLIFREEHRLNVFENRVLRGIFGPKTAEVTGDWRKLHEAELHDLYSSPSIIRIIKSMMMRWG